MKDVIICGMGDSILECPFDADEIWGVNYIGDEYKDKRFDKIFAFDPPWGEHVVERMKRVAPIVSWQPYADIKYPLEEIKGHFKTNYFSNTICYMIAYAIYLKIPKIRLYGVDAAYGLMYELEKGGIEYWLSKAEDYGVEIEVSKGSNLLRTPTGQLYGEKYEGTIVMNIVERNMFFGMLPVRAPYEAGKYISGAKQILHPSQEEIDTYHIEFELHSNGTSILWKTPTPFNAEIWLPEVIWRYLSKTLSDADKQGVLPIDAASLYERFVVRPSGGDGPKPHEVQ